MWPVLVIRLYHGDNVRTVVFEDTMKGIYKRINISADGKQLLGGILVGDAEAIQYAIADL